MSPITKKCKREPEDARRTMHQYWNRVYSDDMDSKTARRYLKQLEDPESLFHNDKYLHELVDDMEKDKKVKNTRPGKEKEKGEKE